MPTPRRSTPTHEGSRASLTPSAVCTPCALGAGRCVGEAGARGALTLLELGVWQEADTNKHARDHLFGSEGTTWARRPVRFARRASDPRKTPSSQPGGGLPLKGRVLRPYRATFTMTLKRGRVLLSPSGVNGGAEKPWGWSVCCRAAWGLGGSFPTLPESSQLDGHCDLLCSGRGWTCLLAPGQRLCLSLVRPEPACCSGRPREPGEPSCCYRPDENHLHCRRVAWELQGRRQRPSKLVRTNAVNRPHPFL